MKCAKTVGFCFASLLALSFILSANGGVLTGNPYKPIATRNVFGLSAMSLQQPAPPPAPLGKISLTGITTVLGSRDVLFKVSDPAEPGKPEKSYILEEGQIQDDVEVMSIDTKESLAVFKNHGVIQKIPLGSGTESTPETKAPPIPGTL